jgi:hypothetical protein
MKMALLMGCTWMIACAGCATSRPDSQPASPLRGPTRTLLLDVVDERRGPITGAVFGVYRKWHMRPCQEIVADDAGRIAYVDEYFPGIGASSFLLLPIHVAWLLFTQPEENYKIRAAGYRSRALSMKTLFNPKTATRDRRTHAFAVQLEPARRRE